MIGRVFVAVMLAAMTLPATAQIGGGATSWRCRHANQSVTGNRFENWLYEFSLALAPGGRFQAQGTYTAMTAGFSVPFVAEGQWQQSGQGVLVQGFERRQDGYVQPLTLVFTSVGGGVMSNRFQSPQGILLTHCQS